ncbi:MAG: adenosylmethionine--8-amino-7-oxononanoate transaminase [Flavobacteriales bacterium]|nr:adenosylmethionine--8-amino-7-oxononanoate transaminase [Flavobacteriales bacterium]
MSDWRENDRNAVWHPFTAVNTDTVNVPIVRGEGVWLIDADGKRYLDAISSWWVNLHGHCNPYIAKRVADQVMKLEHVMFAGFTHEPAVELAARLLEKMPNQFTKVFYSDNGSTAVEVALKMSFQYWFNQGKPRRKVIALENAYHGDTFGAMAVGGRGVFSKPFDPFLFEVEFIPTPAAGKESECLDRLSQIIEKEEVASFICEPLVQGTAGMQVYSPEVLDKMISMCRDKGIIIIADEVMTGFGRTGTLFAMDQCEQKPDLIALSKGITGGFLPMGVTVCTDEMHNSFWSDDEAGKMKTFLHGHSYTANPLACAAGCASLDLMEKDETWVNIRRIERQHSEFAMEAAELSGVAAVRHKGVILAIEYETRAQTGYFNSLRDRLYDFFMERGIILRPLGNIIYIIPPYCITEEELNLVYQAIREFKL